MGSNELENFDLLEKKIEQLISTVKNLKEEKKKLEREVKEQNERTDSIAEDIKHLIATRELVQSRITRLIEKIDKFNS